MTFEMPLVKLMYSIISKLWSTSSQNFVLIEHMVVSSLLPPEVIPNF